VLTRLVFELDAAQYDPETRPERSAADLLEEVSFLQQHRFWQYTPGQFVLFERRLWLWVSNPGVTPADVRTMLELVTSIQFTDRDDMVGLYRTAFRSQIMRWLIEQAGWTLEQMIHAGESDIRHLVKETWFCPITDSMDIGQFLRTNEIGGNSERPAWKILRRFGSFERVHEFVAARGYKRLVLLEDFVGTGTQAVGPIRAALSELKVPVLFCPLTVSETAINRFERRFSGHPRFTFSPVHVIPTSMHVFRSPVAGEPELFTRIRDLVLRTFDIVKIPQAAELDAPRYPFGFNRICGLLLVQHTNCPNNTIPLVWHDAPNWNALFPRVSRQ